MLSFSYKTQVLDFSGVNVCGIKNPKNSTRDILINKVNIATNAMVDVLVFASGEDLTGEDYSSYIINNKIGGKINSATQILTNIETLNEGYAVRHSFLESPTDVIENDDKISLAPGHALIFHIKPVKQESSVYITINFEEEIH
jgi:hypothetical protein